MAKKPSTSNYEVKDTLAERRLSKQPDKTPASERRGRRRDRRQTPSIMPSEKWVSETALGIIEVEEIPVERRLGPRREAAWTEEERKRHRNKPGDTD
ncbi:MAG: hypothetical protein ACREUA_03730 [Burkholderiales bacterium]